VFSLSNLFFKLGFVATGLLFGKRRPLLYSTRHSLGLNSTPDTTRSFIRSRRPGSRLDRRSIASPTSTTTVIQSYTPDGCLRNLRAGLPAHAYRLRFRVISQSWTLRAQSELPGVTMVGLPGSQVLRSWLCSLQWFLRENQHNLPIVGTGPTRAFLRPKTPSLFAASTS